MNARKPLKWRYQSDLIDPIYHAQGRAGHFELFKQLAERDQGYGRVTWYLHLNNVVVDAFGTMLEGRQCAQALEDNA